MHLFSSHLWPRLGGVSRTGGWQEHPHVNWAGETVYREGSFVTKVKNIPKGGLEAGGIFRFQFLDGR